MGITPGGLFSGRFSFCREAFYSRSTPCLKEAIMAGYQEYLETKK